MTYNRYNDLYNIILHDIYISIAYKQVIAGEVIINI